MTRTTGPCFTVACGCASGSVQLGHAQRMIAAGEIELAAVTGVDVFNRDVIRTAERLLGAPDAPMRRWAASPARWGSPPRPTP
ncbi:beta-ketoacyl synthase N-terminal-like domain-containing protein [Streptomyces sp. FXJ1.4098]|nr:beta-ketoacyl synthase N-terminal-like domain-containing protein [Streptomyces sp. FXJ1.4098]